MRSDLPPSLPFDLWPERDRKAWEDGCSPDPLEGGAGSAWKPSTRKHTLKLYGLWLGWHRARGSLDAMAPPSVRASREVVKAYRDDLEAAGLSDYARAGRLQGLGDALRVLEPDADCGFIARAAGRTSYRAKRARDLRSRMRPVREVYDLGLELMAQADSDAAASDYDRALLFRDGVVIALWSLRGLRCANLGEIAIGRNLIQTSDSCTLEFAASEMKAKRPFSCPWPEALVQPLDAYLKHHRAVLRARDMSGRPEDALWISQFGRGMQPRSIAQMIRIRTRAKFGEGMGTHIMRQMLSTLVAEEAPGRITDVPAIMAHATPATSEKHYNLARGLKASRMFQASVLAGQPRLL